MDVHNTTGSKQARYIQHSCGKTVAYSAQELVYRVTLGNLNAKGTLYGGHPLFIADGFAAEIALRHSGFGCDTLFVDGGKFWAPAYLGDVLIFKGSVNRVWDSSLEVGVRIVVRRPESDQEEHLFSAYFTFVALDENRKPIQVCTVIPETKEEKRRFKEAQRRRNYRLKHNKKKAYT
ncbi:MAG: hypothetical protein A3A80_02765 [Candidatus Terrybacteria bacterium RIFCSPLOWO2_01_FULL_44_24]|uniref:HotDog ACOT-type domain-containing protein n=1 Tax=Candidatus Terrybacteria bacterium RIFCSPHIGHO2_01_FULL_43_35 TaxID=1802361 RepID=A0A1G2PEP6_9BACT|nr:MAG: hypothetical protein A2828_02555 [Candidatus Terrybacteria bacterium RIFCSPHIGHO2_01_FULL_43_35]OHA50258.1 MAG: hypothetical protein A3B75_00445 [Candidatus Terrybacteria bacterium RIFCSPHIGHO2_02_FULL_43_14]OHA50991.1 MAG: hypothetical protein A3A80_02765 [Candidatus Terrybacteria bacterium RIFCSPLOWO2_01_FULL_44_24]